MSQSTAPATAVKSDTAEQFVGSVFKFSISTVANICIYGLSLLLINFFVSHEVQGQMGLFTSYTNTIMTIAILGLDQAFTRFFHEPPNGLSSNGLFRICFYFSSAALLLGGAICSTLLLTPMYNLIGFSMVGKGVIPLVFMNALFFMFARYFNTLYRMEMNVKIYTIQSVLMQFFYKLFYLVGALFGFETPLPAMIFCSLLGLGSLALVFCLLRRRALRPRLKEFRPASYKSILPYGLAVAPTAVFVVLNGAIPLSFITNIIGEAEAGVYSYAYALSNVVTLIQGGFASFWAAYMFKNYKTQKVRIMRVHDYLNFIILVFFAFLVAAEDLIFLVLANYRDALPIFPLVMLSAVSTILCETTVYGNAIARKPIFDTIGIGISFIINVSLCVLMIGPLNMGLFGAALAVAIADFAMYLFRTIIAQRFYRTIRFPVKTTMAILVAIALTAAGTVFAYQFLIKLICATAAIVIYCLMYRAEFLRFWQLGVSILKSLFLRRKA